MYRIAILGCENSHANGFLELIKNGAFSDICVLGVYSDEPETAKALNEKYGVPVMESYDSLVGELDGLIVTARHGDNHYKYAKPYMKSGIPMFIDKPITCTEDDVRAMMMEAKENGVRLTGGSMLGLMDEVIEAKRRVDGGEIGDIVGGNVTSPVSSENNYGGFFFYSQHLVGTLTSVFGCDVKSVYVTNNGSLNVIFRYEKFDVTATYLEGVYKYSVGVYGTKGVYHSPINVASYGFERELSDFASLLKGGEMQYSYADFASAVFILNAIVKAKDSGEWVEINTL